MDGTGHMKDPGNFELLRKKLTPLLDRDPAKAIAEAEKLPAENVKLGILLSGLKSGILIDAGSRVRNKEAISEGVSILKVLVQEYPQRADLQYNLANGLIALADQEPFKGFDWFLATGAVRQEARSHFHKALSLKGAEKIASVTLTNLGNALWKGHRWVEAYDSYIEALNYDATNGVAATGAVKILLGCRDRGIGNPKILLCVAARHLRAARKHPKRIRELAGAHAYKELSGLLKQRVRGGQMPSLNHASPYERFVATYRLALSPTIEGLDLSLKRWDSLMIRSFIEPVGSSSGVPPIFAMFNVLKSDFLAARHLAYQALKGANIPDSGFYSDTLDYAIYGVKPSALTLAQRACMDVLDKIAVATTEYFSIKGPKNIYFSNRWFAEAEKGQPPQWHPILAKEIRKGNNAIIALAELSLDISQGGFLHEKKAYRHSSTHQFTILHDLGCQPSRPCSRIIHAPLGKFESDLVQSLQLVRAAIIYFMEMIQFGEGGKKTDPGKIAPMTVPSHHWIRGEDEEQTEE